jgi:hypothetical protein
MLSADHRRWSPCPTKYSFSEKIDVRQRTYWVGLFKILTAQYNSVNCFTWAWVSPNRLNENFRVQRLWVCWFDVVLFYLNMGVKKVPGAPPIPSLDRHKQTYPSLFRNVLSPVLNDPFKSVHSIMKDALDLIECEVIPGHLNCLFNFIMRMKLSIRQDSFQHPEEPKVAWAQVWRIGWVRKSCNVMLVEFWHDFDPLWHFELSICTQKVASGIRRRNFPVFRF